MKGFIEITNRSDTKVLVNCSHIATVYVGDYYDEGPATFIFFSSKTKDGGQSHVVVKESYEQVKSLIASAAGD